MSFKTTALVLDHGPSDALAKLVLLSLADRSNEQGICWPSRDDLIARTKVSYSTISRKLRYLEKENWIQRKRQFNSSTVFRLNLQRLNTLEAEANAAKLSEVPKGFEAFPGETVTPQAIENKGTVHCDPTLAHCDPTLAHSELLTYQKPIYNQRLRRASSNSLKKGPASGGVSTPVNFETIQRKSEWLSAATGKPFAQWVKETYGLKAEKVGAL